MTGLFIKLIGLKPLEVREAKKSEHFLKIERLGYWYTNTNGISQVLDAINAIEIGKIVARDIGGSDPERMAASNILAYVKDIFHSTDIKVIATFIQHILFIYSKNKWFISENYSIKTLLLFFKDKRY